MEVDNRYPPSSFYKHYFGVSEPPCSWTNFFQSFSAYIRDRKSLYSGQHTWIWYGHLSLLMGRPHSCWAYQISGLDGASYLVPDSYLNLEFLLCTSPFCWVGHYISCHLTPAENSLFSPLFFSEEDLVIFNRTCDIGGLWKILTGLSLIKRKNRHIKWLTLKIVNNFPKL